MDIQAKTIDDVTVLTLAGEITSQNAAEVQAQLLAYAIPGRKILLNMTGVQFLSSAGLRTLLILYRQIESQKSCIALAGLQDRIRDVMSMTGFLQFFDTYDAEAEGVAALHQCANQ